MVRIITVDDIKKLIRKVTLKEFLSKLMERLAEDFARWSDFQKEPRVAAHFPHGVIELMPIHDWGYYAFKYVNGHPNNPEQNKQTVVALGQLADVETGYPLMISEMTILTALRTAATSALAAKFLAPKSCEVMGVIGTGAQSEFQVVAHHVALGIKKVYYFDLDAKAMAKFANNLQSFPIELIPCSSAQEVVEASQIVTTATAAKKKVEVIHASWIRPGLLINGIGGDCPGKTELSSAVLHRTDKIVVEFMEQSAVEGEIQAGFQDKVHAELWEIIIGKKPGRERDDEVILFDSVGFALEDYSILRHVYTLAEMFHVGHLLDLVPEPEDPKNLFGVLGC